MKFLRNALYFRTLSGLTLLWLLGSLQLATAQPLTLLDPAVETQALAGSLLVIPDPQNNFSMEAVASGQYGQPQSAEPAQAYTIRIDGISPTEGAGWILERNNAQILVRSAATPATIYAYPQSTLVLAETNGASSECFQDAR